MTDFGIKVVKAGKSVWGTDWRDLILHSDYSMFKYHSETSTSMTINVGDTTKSVSFAHNLGYVPAFIGYIGDGTSIYQLPQRTSTISGHDEHWYIYADSTNIYISWASATPLGLEIYSANDRWNDRYTNNWSYEVGGRCGGAVRFGDVTIPKNTSVTSALLKYIVNVKGTDTNDLKMKTYGIDEDNTGEFSSQPMTRDKTTAYKEQTQAMSPSVTFDFGIDVKNMVNEIVSRSGWSSGNNMGFIFNDNGSNSDTWAYFGVPQSVSDSKLEVTSGSSVTYNFRVIVFKDKIS